MVWETWKCVNRWRQEIDPWEGGNYWIFQFPQFIENRLFFKIYSKVIIQSMICRNKLSRFLWECSKSIMTKDIFLCLCVWNLRDLAWQKSRPYDISIQGWWDHISFWEPWRNKNNLNQQKNRLVWNFNCYSFWQGI